MQNRQTNKSYRISSPEKSSILTSTENSINTSGIENNDYDSFNESINLLFKCHKNTSDDIKNQKSLMIRTNSQIKSLEESICNLHNTLLKINPSVTVNLSIPEREKFAFGQSYDENMITRDSLTIEDSLCSYKCDKVLKTPTNHRSHEKENFKPTEINLNSSVNLSRGFKNLKSGRMINFDKISDCDSMLTEFNSIIEDTKMMVKTLVENTKKDSNDNLAFMNAMAKSIEHIVQVGSNSC